jgi:predicted N-acyltransferase
VKEFQTVLEISWAGWENSLGPHQFYASVDWLRIAEATADRPPFYLYGEQMTALPCYPLTTESPFPLCRADLMVRRALPGPAGAALADRMMPTLFLGGRNPGHTGIGWAGLTDSDDRVAAGHALVAHAERVAAERGLRSVGMLYVDEDDDVVRHVLRDRDYVHVAHEQAAVLTVLGARPDDHVHGRDAGTVRRETRKLERAGVRFEVSSFASRFAQDVDRLEINLNRKYGNVFDDDAVRELRGTISAVLGDRLLVGLAGIDDRTVGSLLMMRWRDELYARTAGFDYPAIEGLPVYFGLLFYHLVGYASRTGVHTIHYSIGSADAKRRRGCRLVRQHAYLKALDTTLHRELTHRVARSRP